MFQILLLPQKNYWDWVRACREYVMTYGVHLTPDPAAAARYMAPRQVVTFPDITNAFAQARDIQAWFASNYPEVMLDPIDVEAPEDLAGELSKRLAEGDRFGQKDRSFFMLWPTEYPVITQRFGANARIYSRFGMPGHEGVDIRALPNTKIFACAEGDVYRVERNPKGHSYGIHVRIRHSGGYRTIYGHLARADVKVGQHVDAGEVIGSADSTGASVGSHLHLSLKQDHATDTGQTNYPKDIIDPTEYLVWPDSGYRKTAEIWGPGKCLVGAHGRIGAALTNDDLQAIETARLEALVVDIQESSETIDKLRDLRPSLLFMSRLTADFSDEQISPKGFVSIVRNDLENLYRQNVHYFEVRPNPNLQNTGWERTWSDGREFGAWFVEVAHRLRERYPDLQLGFPGLSPGPLVPGKREDQFRFLESAAASVLEADWVGVNSYWRTAEGMDGLSEGRVYEEYRLMFPEMLLFVTEFGNPDGDVLPSVRANQYLEFFRRLRQQPGIGAAFSFAISAEEGHLALTWNSTGLDDERIAGTLGSRTF